MARANRWKALAIGALVASAPLSATSTEAAPIAATGTFSSDDAVALLDFVVTAFGSVTLRTLSYNGGTFADGSVVPAGGFDPILTLFNAAGAAIAVNDDQVAFDAEIVRDLVPGVYTVALTQYDNFVKNTTSLSGGFQRDGEGNFTQAFGCLAGRFCDNGGRNRSGDWAVEISGSVEAPGSGEVAVSAPAALFLPVLIPLALAYRGRRHVA